MGVSMNCESNAPHESASWSLEEVANELRFADEAALLQWAGLHGFVIEEKRIPDNQFRALSVERSRELTKSRVPDSETGDDMCAEPEKGRSETTGKLMFWMIILVVVMLIAVIVQNILTRG